MEEPSQKQLLELVLVADEEALHEGKRPKQRFIPVMTKVMAALGYVDFQMFGEGTPPIVKRITDLHSSLYRERDLAVGGIHEGVFMFRDVFARLYVPISYGTVTVDPFRLTDLNRNQIQWLARRPQDLGMFIDQFIDIFDFAGGIGTLGDYKRPPEVSMKIFRLATFQYQAATAALRLAFDSRGAIQSALIATELALKAGLAAAGVDEAARRKHSHDLASAANAYAKLMPEFDLPRVAVAIERMPAYVENRYSNDQPSRLETGHIAMGAQYIGAEVMRQLTGYTIRSAISGIGPRTYPRLGA